MPYYQGDFYAFPGTAYRGYGGPGKGDPGFWSTVLNFGKRVVGAVVPGAGAITSLIPDVGSKTASSIVKASAPTVAEKVGRSMGMAAGRASQIVRAHPGMAAGAAVGIAGAAAGTAAIIKHRGGTAVVHTGSGRRRRRMNVCNPRALRKAIRRTHGFAKLAMKTIHLVHPKKKASFGGFKKRRRK